MISNEFLKRNVLLPSEKENSVTSDDSRLKNLNNRFANLGVTIERSKKER